MFEEILEKIKSHSCIVIHRHKNPDGDAIGAQAGLYCILRENFPEKEVYAVGDMNERYAFMTQGRPFDTVSDEKYGSALAIVLDTASKALVSDTRYETAKESIRIDHHVFSERIADTELVDTSFESACGMITHFAMESGLTVSSRAAKLLYTGMITDSGRFRYDSTSKKTFLAAAFLAEKEFETADIYKNLYSDSLDFMRLRATYVLKIQKKSDRVAYVYTEKEEADSFGFDLPTISRGMVNVMAEIRGVDRWVNFTETDDGVVCEIRSNKYNVNRLAARYGGGGHARASGATLESRDVAMKLLDDLVMLENE